MENPNVLLRKLLDIKKKCSLICNRCLGQNLKFFARSNVEFVYFIIELYYETPEKTCLNLAKQLFPNDFSSNDVLIPTSELYNRFAFEFSNFIKSIEGAKDLKDINEEFVTKFKKSWENCKLLGLDSPRVHPFLNFAEFEDFVELRLNGLSQLVQRS